MEVLTRSTLIDRKDYPVLKYIVIMQNHNLPESINKRVSGKSVIGHRPLTKICKINVQEKLNHSRILQHVGQLKDHYPHY